MGEFIKAIGAVLITLILVALLNTRDKPSASVLTMIVCTAVLMLGLQFFAPVIDFLQQLEELTGLQNDMVNILLKVSGIGILTEITVLLCADSGNASLGQSMRILSTAVILWMSLPIFQALLQLVRQILEGI